MACRLYQTLAAGAASLCLWGVSSLDAPACAAEAYSEDVVKAAYLYRFAGYINWPEREAPDTPFIVDVLGAPGVARELRRLLPTHPINNRVAQVREITGSGDWGDAQIVYVAAGHAQSLRTLNPVPGVHSMLLVTDEEEGLRDGGVVNFVTVDRNVRFEVSLAAADRWGLKISSELLGVAIRVQGIGRHSHLGCMRLNDAVEIAGPCESRIVRQAAPIGMRHPGTGA